VRASAQKPEIDRNRNKVTTIKVIQIKYRTGTLHIGAWRCAILYITGGYRAVLARLAETEAVKRELLARLCLREVCTRYRTVKTTQIPKFSWSIKS
jgi:hypothetical protein